jgi:hypothetical protein
MARVANEIAFSIRARSCLVERPCPRRQQQVREALRRRFIPSIVPIAVLRLPLRFRHDGTGTPINGPSA